MDSNEDVTGKLRAAFALAAARLTPDIEPAFVYAWRETTPDPEPDDAD
jgi:hypothetical protein